MNPKELRELADNDDLLEVGRQAIEDELIEFRDSGFFQIRANGLVCRTVDAQESSIIRFGPEYALSIGLKAIANKLESQ